MGMLGFLMIFGVPTVNPEPGCRGNALCPFPPPDRAGPDDPVGRPYIGGQAVLLRVVPVAPRDLMRGDYVTLSYDISRMSPPTTGGWTSGDPSNRRVYVALEPEADGKHFKGSAASFTRPATGPYIQGTAEGWGRINFGIESYYVQEGRGRDYEKAVRERRLSAEVVLGYDGSPTLHGLVIE